MESWDHYTIMLECIITGDVSIYSIGYIVIYMTYVLKILQNTHALLLKEIF